MIGVVQIPQENIESVWALVDDAITKALAYSGHHYNTQDVLDACKSGDNQLWLVWNEETEPKLKGERYSDKSAEEIANIKEYNKIKPTH